MEWAGDDFAQPEFAQNLSPDIVIGIGQTVLIVGEIACQHRLSEPQRRQRQSSGKHQQATTKGLSIHEVNSTSLLTRLPRDPVQNHQTAHAVQRIAPRLIKACNNICGHSGA